MRLERLRVPSAAKEFIRGLARTFTGIDPDRVDRALAKADVLESKLSRLEQALDFVLEGPRNAWLYRNRVERMDATVEFFDAARREFHLDRYRFAAEKLQTEAEVLDCACGTGYGVGLLKRDSRARHVIGIDIDSESVSYARGRHGVGDTDFVCGSGTDLPFGNATFHAITSFETVEHVGDDMALLGEFHRVLRPGGTLIISTPNQWPLEIAPHHVRVYDRESFQAVLQAAGFEVTGLWNQNSGSPSIFNHDQPRGIVETTDHNHDFAECFVAVSVKGPPDLSDSGSSDPKLRTA